MSRQEAFEKIYAKLHDVTPESLVQYRFCTTDGYRLPQMSSHYRVYCETMDSMAGELQDAKRYRWLRRTEDWSDFSKAGEPWIVNARDEVGNQTGEDLDAGVDFAMSKGNKP